MASYLLLQVVEQREGLQGRNLANIKSQQLLRQDCSGRPHIKLPPVYVAFPAPPGKAWEASYHPSQGPGFTWWSA